MTKIRVSIAVALLAVPKLAEYTPMKPIFKNDILESDNPAFDSFVGPWYWLAFNLLGSDNNRPWLLQFPTECFQLNVPRVG